jgi:hypothetical protein
MWKCMSEIHSSMGREQAGNISKAPGIPSCYYMMRQVSKTNEGRGERSGRGGNMLVVLLQHKGGTRVTIATRSLQSHATSGGSSHTLNQHIHTTRLLSLQQLLLPSVKLVTIPQLVVMTNVSFGSMCSSEGTQRVLQYYQRTL